MRQSVRRLTFAAATLAMFVPAVASAQQQPKAQETPQQNVQQQPQTQAPDTTQDIPDQKIDAAAAAMQQVASLKQTFQQRYDTAPPSDKERIANEASAALTKVVTDNGLSIEEYSAILETAQNNPEVRGKILARIRTPPQ